MMKSKLILFAVFLCASLSPAGGGAGGGSSVYAEIEILDRGKTVLGTNTTGITPVEQGGTGSNTAAGARQALGVAKSGDNDDITSADNLRLKVGTSTYGKPVYVLFQDHTQHSLTGTTTETVVYTSPDLAGVMGTNSTIIMHMRWSMSGTSSSAPFYYINFRGNKIHRAGGNNFTPPAQTASITWISTTGSTSTQIYGSSTNPGLSGTIIGGATGTLSVNTSNTFYITATIVPGAAVGNAALDSICAEILP